MDITTVRSTALPHFMLLYAALYAAFGVASPFLPALVNERGLPAVQLGLVLSAGTAVRLLTAPLAGRLGDVIQGLRVVLVICIVLAAVVTLGYLPAHGFWPFLASACCMPRRWRRSPSWRMRWRWVLRRHRLAAAAAGSSTGGCAGLARRPSSAARCCRVHKGFEGVTARGLELGGIAAPRRFGGDSPGGALAREKVAEVDLLT